jgi:Terminase large subunit, T4likevirus-type, N-terminal
MYPIVKGWYKHPRFRGIIFRRTYPELESEIIYRSQSGVACLDGKVVKFSDFGAKYNSEKRRWIFPGGGSYSFGHAEFESDVRKYDTAEYNYMAFDELTSFTEFQYKYLSLSRCRSSSSLPALVRSGTNPGNVGHAWVRKHFIEPSPYGTVIVDRTTKLKRIFIPAKVDDNPHIDPGYINRLSALPEAERRAKRDGDWWTFEGQVFDDFRENHFPDEPENALHVIEPFSIPSWWIRLFALDWGYTAMTYGLWGALSPEGRVILYREYACKQTKIADWASDIKRLTGEEDLSDVILCQSAWQNRGGALTVAEEFEKYSGLRPSLADNDRISGKLLIQEMLRWRPKAKSKLLNNETYSNEKAAQIMRQYGMDAYREYLTSFEPEEEETNLPKLQIFNTLPVLIKTIPLCIYDKKSSVTNKPAEDVKEFDGDDPYDCLRYLLKGASFRLQRGNPETEKRNKVSEVLSNFEKDKDYTSLHRRLERIEATVSKSYKAIKRFHRKNV